MVIATLGSILDSQLSWESGKFQLARWSHEVVLFSERTTHPPTIWIFLVEYTPLWIVCPHLLCLSPPIMCVPTYRVCPHLLCLSPTIMSVPTYYVCPHLLSLFSPMFTCCHSRTPSWMFSLAENLASSILQDGALNKNSVFVTIKLRGCGVRRTDRFSNH